MHTVTLIHTDPGLLAEFEYNDENGDSVWKITLPRGGLSYQYGVNPQLMGAIKRVCREEQNQAENNPQQAEIEL